MIYKLENIRHDMRNMRDDVLLFLRQQTWCEIRLNIRPTTEQTSPFPESKTQIGRSSAFSFHLMVVSLRNRQTFLTGN